MATIKLVPSSYSLSNTQYLTVSSANNMYADTSSTTYATISNTRQSTTSYYIYLSGFNVNSVSDDWIINSITIRIRGYESGLSTSASYAPRLYNGTSTISGASAASQTFSTSASTITVPYTGTFATLKSYGSNLGIRCTVRRANSGTAGYLYLYGAEIEVDYTVPVYHDITAASSVTGVTISPSTQEALEGSDLTLVISADSIDDIVVTDNDVDVTADLVSYTPGGTPTTTTFIPSSFDSTNSSYASVYNNNNPENGLTEATSSTRCCVYSNTTNGSESSLWYNFDCSSIPNNAIIESVTCQVGASCYSSGSYFSTKDLQLFVGTATAKGSAVTVTGNGSTSAQHTVNGGTTWTRSELDNLKIRFRVIRSQTGDASFSFFGATLSVTYSIPVSGTYWSYTLTNITEDHVILIDPASAIEPPDLDPMKTYWPLTISSINASTDPVTGTTMVEQGTNSTITITPTDPQLTLALDNGVDVTSQLVSYMPSNTYTVTTQASGASYGFPLNSGTGYYTSNNNGQSNSAAVARVNFNLETECLVTIQYINYAEATYDYGIFGQIDTALGTTYTADSNAYHVCSAQSDNTASVQTLTYTIPSGTHFIDIKYRKDSYTDSNNDNLQWKISSIESTGAAGYYTYTLTNITQKHSLIFVFGDIDYYFITSSLSTSGGMLFPDGQQVKLEGNTYRLVIIPDNVNATVSITDNNVNRTSYLERIDGYDKHDNPIVNYIYNLSNIQAAHTLVVSITSSSQKIYLKENNVWVQYSKVYLKVNGAWVEQAQSSWANLFDTSANYVKEQIQ